MVRASRYVFRGVRVRIHRMNWTFRDKAIDLSEKPVVMGVLNVTPDSFSDGGQFHDVDAAVGHASAMIDAGAAIIDVGPESTRPGSDPTSADVQIERVRSVIPAVRKRHPRTALSIDTRLAAVAMAALDWGADIVNDVSALRDDADMTRLVRESGCGLIMMHMKSRPKDMQEDGNLYYVDVVRDVGTFLRQHVGMAVRAGVERNRIAVDPGIGFGKTTDQNLELLGRMREIVDLGHPVVVGASRKRFIGEVLGQPDPQDRQIGSLTSAVAAVLAGVQVVRVHDVHATVQAVAMAHAIRMATSRGENEAGGYMPANQPMAP